MRPNQEYYHLLTNVNYALAILENGEYQYTSEQSEYWVDLQSGYDCDADGLAPFDNPPVTCGTWSFGTRNGNITYLPSTGALCNFNLLNRTTPDLSNELTSFYVFKIRTADNKFYLQQTDKLEPTGMIQFGQPTKSRFQFTYNDTTSAGGLTYVLKTARDSGGTEYSPALNTWCLAIGRIDSSRNRSFKVNGYGDNFGGNHIAGSYTSETTTNSFGGTPSDNRILTQELSENEDAEFGELITWGTALTNGEVEALENYLKTKWGISY